MRKELRAYLRRSEGKLAMIAALTSVSALLLGLIGLVVLQGRQNLLDDAVERRGVLTSAALDIYRAFADADATSLDAVLGAPDRWRLARVESRSVSGFIVLQLQLFLPNRIVMAPMTRSFSPGGVPRENVAAYYRRRAEGEVGLILTEGTVVNRPASRNDPGIPFFHSEDPLAGWDRVVREVHAAGGRIGAALVALLVAAVCAGAPGVVTSNREPSFSGR